LLSERELKDAALLIFANKQVKTLQGSIIFRLLNAVVNCVQDVEGSVTAEELCQQMVLPKLCCGRSWHCQPCSAQSGDGLTEGLEWLSRQLTTETTQ
jgi:tripartite motif-containing protein 23